jgi:PTH1 family peptidyl-tRNA hydrolase
LANTHQTKGSDGGHNGLKNINLILNTNQYTRFRFGISDEFKKGKQIDYVRRLGRSRKIRSPERLEVAYEIIKSLELQDWKIP